jgi:transposase
MDNHTSSYAGIDWGASEHRLCIIDQQGRTLLNRVIEHSSDGLAELLTLLRKHARDDRMRVAIERPNGVLVDTLSEAGYQVVAIHPNAVKATRSRYRAASSKNDASDAYLLADVLRTDGHRFSDLQPRSDEMRAIRRLSRARSDLIKQRVSLSNQLAATLQASWPSAEHLFADLASPIALAFIERYPSPRDTNGLGLKRMLAFLKRNRYSGRQDASALIAHLKAAPASLEGPLEAKASREVVLSLTRLLTNLVQRIKDLTSALEHASAQSTMGQLVMSFPRTGHTNAAQIVAELGDDPSRFTSRDQLASEAGLTPVTRASGKRHTVGFRYACNKALRSAFTTWANNSRKASPWAEAIYQKARARGCRHPHAIRILARTWSRVLYACWTNGTLYDPTTHHAKHAQTTPTG